MKKFMYVYLLLIISVILSSCFDKNVNNTNLIKNIGNPPDWASYNWTSYSGINPANPNNPYDSEGQIHNNTLDYIICKYDTCSTGSIYARDSIVKYAAEYCIIMGSTLSQDSLINFMNISFDYTGLTDFESNVAYYSTSQAIANKKIDFFEYVFTTADTITVVIDSCIAWETRIYNDTMLTTIEKEDFLKFMSTFRFSYVYWNDVNLLLRNDYPYISTKRKYDKGSENMHSKKEAAQDAHFEKVVLGGENFSGVFSFCAGVLDDITDAIGDAFIAVGNWVKDLF
jgi:hypothetical protein